MVTAFTERIAGAWLDAAAHADHITALLLVAHDTAATHWAEKARRYENQASMVADLTLEGATP